MQKVYLIAIILLMAVGINARADNLTSKGIYAYTVNENNNSYSKCAVDDTNGALTNCTTSTAWSRQFADPVGILVNAGYIYITNSKDNSYTVCKTDNHGALTACVAHTLADLLNYPTFMAADESVVYIINASGNSYAKCSIDLANNGALTKCDGNSLDDGVIHSPFAIAINDNDVYIDDYAGNYWAKCPIYRSNDANNGTLRPCTKSNSLEQLDKPMGIAIDGANVYMVNYGNNSYTHCRIDHEDKNFTNCSTFIPDDSGVLDHPGAIAINDGYAYITNYGNNSYTQCKINADDGLLAECKTIIPKLANGTDVFNGPIGIAIKKI